MASLRTSAAQTAFREARKPYICPRCELRRMGCSVVNYPSRRQLVRYSSTASSSVEAPAPPLLSKLKGDLKTAMRAKDTPRLNVLRALITEYNNASKTSNPIRTDLQLLAAMKKRRASSEAAASEARAANREDLEHKQQQEISVIDEYAGSVDVMSEDEIRQQLSKLLTALRDSSDVKSLKLNDVLKLAFQPSGVFDGQPVDRGEVVKILKEMIDDKR